jgi:hypothetical protein
MDAKVHHSGLDFLAFDIPALDFPVLMFPVTGISSCPVAAAGGGWPA